MKIKYLSVIWLTGVFILNSHAQTDRYQSITNLSIHISSLHSSNLTSRLFPNVSTNTRDFYFPSETAFQNVFFSTSITNQVLVVGSTNILRCRLDNQSTNEIRFWSLTFACLTNSSRSFYQLLPELEPPNTNGGPTVISNRKPGPSFFNVGAEKIQEWDLSFVIDKHIQQGVYELQSSQGVITADFKYSWELISIPLHVRVVKRL